MNRRRLAIAAALAPLAALAAGEPLAPGDFAWGRAVETQSSDPLQTLLLDVAIYRGAVGPDLADLRVFNGAGEVVPHAIRSLVDPHEERGALVEVPLFRVPEGSALARGAGPSGIVRERDIAIEVAADGAIVRVGSGPAAGEADARLPSAYLLDLSQLEKEKRAVVGLDLALAPEPAEFAVALRVEASDDLVHFSPVTARAALARLDQAGHRIERNEVEISAVASRYLLLSAAQPLPVELTAARARLASVALPPPRTRERIEGVLTQVSRSPQGREAAAQRGEAERSVGPRKDGKASEDHQAGERAEFLFDLGGPIPIDRVQVDLPVPNSVVEVDLYSAADPDGPWLHHFQGLLYQLDRAEGALRNDELTVPPIRRRYFKLAVAEKGGGLGGGAPGLEVSWMPEQLLFVARGTGPFALGYGRAQAVHARFDAADLIRSALPPNVAASEIPRETARLGPVKPVGDPSVLEPRAQPPSPRTLALWAVLVGSVAFVLALSVRLLRRMGSPNL